MDPLYVIKAIVKHDEAILPKVIVDKIMSLTIEQVPQEHLLFEKNETEALSSYKSFMLFSIQQYYKSMFCQHLDLETWYQIIETNKFLDDYYVAPVRKIYDDDVLTPFQKERKMNELLHSLAGVIYDGKNELRGYLSFDEWTKFFHTVKLYHCHDIMKSIYRIKTYPPIRCWSLSCIQSDFSFFSFVLDWKEVGVSSNHVILNYFHPSSHYEDSTFYCENKYETIVHYIHRDGSSELGNEIIYKRHFELAQTTNWKEYILHVPMSYFNSSYLSLFESALSIPDIPFPKWKGSLGDSLNSLHNLFGRILPEFPCYRYHVFLHEHWEQLNIAELFFANNKILFPELAQQSSIFQEFYETQWQHSLEYFKSLFLYKIEKQFNPSVQKPEIHHESHLMEFEAIPILHLVHSKNMKYFNMDPPSLWNDNNLLHEEIDFCRSALDALFFNLNSTKKT